MNEEPMCWQATIADVYDIESAEKNRSAGPNGLCMNFKIGTYIQQDLGVT